MKKPLRQAVLLFGAALFLAGLSLSFHPVRPIWTRPEVARITVAAIHKEQSQALWVDARSRADYEKEHVPGAVLLNEDEWDICLPAVLAAWQPGQRIIVYCSDRGCRASESVARRLKTLDLTPVFVLDGGWDAWRAQS